MPSLAAVEPPFGDLTDRHDQPSRHPRDSRDQLPSLMSSCHPITLKVDFFLMCFNNQVNRETA